MDRRAHTAACLKQIWGKDLEQGLADYFSSQLNLLQQVVLLAADGAVACAIEDQAMAQLLASYTDPD
jgi:hypothetical protein